MGTTTELHDRRVVIMNMKEVEGDCGTVNITALRTKKSTADGELVVVQYRPFKTSGGPNIMNKRITKNINNKY